MKNWFRFLCFFVLSFFVAVFIWASHAVFVLDNVNVYSENGPLENMQVGLIAISCFVFLTPLALKKSSEKLTHLFCFWLCYSFLVRELEIERLDAPDFLVLIGSGIGRNIILAVGFISLTGYALSKFSYYKEVALAFLKSKTGLLLMLGGLFLVIGTLFEISSSINQNVLFEELFELGGYCFILVSALSLNFISTPETSSVTMPGKI
ncbi:hypothetical protein [Methylicorpusculum sp.]|uniref:hypothetical protein n=1 Tax=Methylicorpusculum sp. TaxID=2713644 RepID=UPI0027300719|nr:hypothetical protein [Methylicorpusculum sp.]MDP2179695.1 hypothetical protein [Methylicorpusculum sp.]MDP3530916.1 hypothetical protein [Methylicorpusculum sp.]MDZ4150544.1 hypothetical protein [Methylicorpusculum sp.]